MDMGRYLTVVFTWFVRWLIISIFVCLLGIYIIFYTMPIQIFGLNLIELFAFLLLRYRGLF